MSVKELIRNAVDQMPEEISFDDALEELEILAAIQRADEAADAGDVIPHEEVKREIASWFSK
ncbi:MAG: hypothetical protein NT013_04775 [Planctomycetia bacterium]|nr:hypothetical protein [Planctomycetia bacterium]